MGAGNGGLFGVGRDDALLLEFLVGLLGGELFGGFDGVFDGVFGGGIVHFDADIVVATALLALVEGALNLEADFLVVLLPPVDEFALEVPVGVSHGVDIEVEIDYLVDDNAAGEFVAFLEVDGTYKCLEGVPVDRFEYTLRLAVVLYQLGEANLLCKFIEVGAADDFRPHFGEEAFPLAGIFLVEEIRHNSAEHCIAKVFETLVVDTPAFAHVQRFGLVDKGNLVQTGIAGYEPQHVLEEKVKLFILAPVTKKVQHLNIFGKPDRHCGRRNQMCC